MIKRTVEISQQPAHLAVRYDQLLIQPHDLPQESHGSIPCEDIGMVLVDNPRCTYSHSALTTLADSGAVLVVCDRSHLPTAVLLPLSDHSEIIWRITDQLSISKPLRKQLWQQIVQAKIRAQSENITYDHAAAGRLRAMSNEVRSGDPTNVEAQAARRYWSAWSPDPDFRRKPDGNDPLNAMLNYGYAVLRAAVARAIVAAGLLPVLGLHHSNRSNNFALADDLLEPLRPMVDRRVRNLYVEHDRLELNQPTKAGLLQLLADPVQVNGESGPLMVNIHRMVSSLVKCYQSTSRELDIPTLVEHG